MKNMQLVDNINMQEDIHDLNGNIQTNHKKLQVTSSHDISI